MSEEISIHGVKLVEKGPDKIDVGEGTFPNGGGRFRGVSVGRTALGFFAFTHRAGSRTYNAPEDIPDSVVEYIRSTG
jgi:hypothetical protein